MALAATRHNTSLGHTRMSCFSQSKGRPVTNTRFCCGGLCCTAPDTTARSITGRAPPPRPCCGVGMEWSSQSCRRRSPKVGVARPPSFPPRIFGSIRRSEVAKYAPNGGCDSCATVQPVLQGTCTHSYQSLPSSLLCEGLNPPAAESPPRRDAFSSNHHLHLTQHAQQTSNHTRCCCS